MKISEEQFKQETAKVYKRVLKALDNIDPDLAEADFHLDNVTITFYDGTRFVINRQPPVKQLWLATKNRGYHFDYDISKKQWLSDHKGHEEFYSLLEANISQIIGSKINI